MHKQDETLWKSFISLKTTAMVNAASIIPQNKVNHRLKLYSQ